MPNAFITGSHAYGEPNEDSDVDLVVLCDYDTIQRLIELSDSAEELRESGQWGPIRFGNLNLVIPPDDTEFAMWKIATATMVREKRLHKKPFSREEAKKRLDFFRDRLGVKDRSDSGE